MTSGELKKQAQGQLEHAAYDPAKLALLHSLVLLILPVLDITNYLLSQQAAVGGLAGMGTRTVVASVQSILSMAYNLLIPFWQISFVGCSLKMARMEQTDPRDYTWGFRRFGPVLRLFLLQALVYIAAITVGSQIAGILYFLTPFSNTLEKKLQQAMAAGQTELTEEMIIQMLPDMVPMLVIAAVIMAVLCIPVFYRLRFSEFAIFEEGNNSALAAMGRSVGMTRGRGMELFRLDLSFWWYNLLVFVASGITDGGVLLSYLGIELPIPQLAAVLILRCVGIGITLLATWRWKSHVQTTYACMYDNILTANTQT